MQPVEVYMCSLVQIALLLQLPDLFFSLVRHCKNPTNKRTDGLIHASIFSRAAVIINFRNFLSFCHFLAVSSIFCRRYTQKRFVILIF
jgi:hypothetical protein